MVESIKSNTNNVNAKAVRAEVLTSKLEEVNDKQGFLGSIWNGFKEITGAGVSKSDCENMVEKYKKGEISFDEAINYIEKFGKKQSTMSDLGANIITGVASIATATALMGSAALWALAFLAGSPVGAVVKTGVKLLDRATNNVKNDALDGKQMLKDAISGAVTGTTSAVSSGVGLGIKAGKFGLAVANGTKCGVQCGALAGASSYLTDVAFDKDKYFNMGDFVNNTVTSAFVSGTVGAGMYGLSNNVGKEVSKSIKQTIIDDATSSSTRKVLGEAERTVMALA